MEKKSKYEVKPGDWSNIEKVKLSIKAQSINCLFNVIENTLASCVTPEEIEDIAICKSKLLTYLDGRILEADGREKK